MYRWTTYLPHYSPPLFRGGEWRVWVGVRHLEIYQGSYLGDIFSGRGAFWVRGYLEEEGPASLGWGVPGWVRRLV